MCECKEQLDDLKSNKLCLEYSCRSVRNAINLCFALLLPRVYGYLVIEFSCRKLMERFADEASRGKMMCLLEMGQYHR
jgi:hypothetical protein